MTCATPSTLTSHIRYRHTTARPWQCELCTYRGKTQQDIKSHVRIHYNLAQLHCPEPGCQYSCRSKLTMKNHQVKFIFRIIAAPHVIGVTNLMQIKTHTSAGQGGSYGCHECDARFSRGVELSRHLVERHDYSRPSGHSRLRYTRHPATGLLTLQTVRLQTAQLQHENYGGPVVDVTDMEAAILQADIFIPEDIDIKHEPVALENNAGALVIEVKEEDIENV